ncbi:hypothetical protein ACJQWK_03453 [Exserohilum turcicum]
MSRNDRGPNKFSFPLPRRVRSKKAQRHLVDDHDHDARSIPPSTASSRPASHYEEPASKAHQILGTANSTHSSTSGRASTPLGSAYRSSVVLPTGAGPYTDDGISVSTRASSAHSSRFAMSRKPSSSVLGYRLHTQTSSSTIRSHYDAKNSPLSISQQTSDSAIRDRALRRGRPPVLRDNGYDGYDGYEASPVSPAILEEARKKENRKSKPTRLDLSRLFPKPKGIGNQRHGMAMLSPTKMVNSPAAMSMNSDYFHHPRSRDRSPQKMRSKLKKNNDPVHHHASVRRVEKDECDNAKVHVRRPPKGVTHWFDALDEDSSDNADEMEPAPAPAPAPRAVRSHGALNHRDPVTQTNQSMASSVYSSRSQGAAAPHKRDSFALEDIVDVRHLASPSQYSVDTYQSQTSSRTKGSALAKTNLQDSSVLSFSSSEDEGDARRSEYRTNFSRQSMDSTEYNGDIVIGRAQMYEVRPTHSRQASSGKMSTLSTSTNAATIEVMYTPDPPLPSYRYSRSRAYSGSKRNSHVRQPSVIHEDEDSRPRTYANTPSSPSTRSVMSARTSASAPQPQSDSLRKLMQVTAEEETLLELMRKKRADMHKQSGSQAPKREVHKQKKTARETSGQTQLMSGFLPTEPYESIPTRMVDTGSRQRASTSTSLSHQSSARGRSPGTNGAVDTGRLREDSTSDAWSDRHHSPASRGKSPHYFLPSSKYSPRAPSPPSSPMPAVGTMSPTTTDHPSPLPSPKTPSHCTEQNVNVKVADSDISNDLDDMPALEHSVGGAGSENIKPDSSRDFTLHRRRRTASSDAEITFPAPPTTTFRDLYPVSEASSRPTSVVEPPAPKSQKKAARHISELALGGIETRNRNSIQSIASRTSTNSEASAYVHSAGRTRSRHLSPDCITSSPRLSIEERDSISEDILAAWNSLGGTY